MSSLQTNLDQCFVFMVMNEEKLASHK